MKLLKYKQFDYNYYHLMPRLKKIALKFVYKFQLNKLMHRNRHFQSLSYAERMASSEYHIFMENADVLAHKLHKLNQ